MINLSVHIFGNDQTVDKLFLITQILVSIGILLYQTNEWIMHASILHATI